MKIIELNREISSGNENLDTMITELVEREEFACSGNVDCGVAACAVKDA